MPLGLQHMSLRGYSERDMGYTLQSQQPTSKNDSDSGNNIYGYSVHLFTNSFPRSPFISRQQLSKMAVNKQYHTSEFRAIHRKQQWIGVGRQQKPVRVESEWFWRLSKKIMKTVINNVGSDFALCDEQHNKTMGQESFGTNATILDHKWILNLTLIAIFMFP